MIARPDEGGGEGTSGDERADRGVPKLYLMKYRGLNRVQIDGDRAWACRTTAYLEHSRLSATESLDVLDS